DATVTGVQTCALPILVRIDPCQAQIRYRAHGEADARANRLPKDFLRIFDHRGDVDRAWVQGFSTREGEQVLDQSGASPGRVQGSLQQASNVRITANAFLSEFKVADDRCQQIVEVVRDAAS